MTLVAWVVEMSGIRGLLYAMVHSSWRILRGEDIATSAWLKDYQICVFYAAYCIYGIMYVTFLYVPPTGSNFK